MDETPRPPLPPPAPPSDPEGERGARLLDAALADAPGARPVRAAPSATEIAALFPDLEILEVLGQGGMGVVYKARQKRLDRLVALKILPRELGEDAAFAERFGREARTLARLDHPHIVRLHEFGETDGLYFLVMEFVDGANLRQVMDGARLTPAEALAIVPQVCEALQYAHDQGVVHRDVKPENILLDERGRVKIADFGLAKLTEGDRADPTLTGTRQVMGTWQYMAPEQYRAPQTVDHRADIFSLGVVFYEMLTGELPVGRYANPSETGALDQRIDAIVMRALERERERGDELADDVRTDVEHLDTTPPTEAPAAAPPPVPLGPPRTRRPGRAALILSLIAVPLGTLGAVVAYYVTRSALDQTLHDAVVAMGVTGTLIWGAGLFLALAGGWHASQGRHGAKAWIAGGILALLNGLAIPSVWISAEIQERAWDAHLRVRRAAVGTALEAPPPRLTAPPEVDAGITVTGLSDPQERRVVVDAVQLVWLRWVGQMHLQDVPVEDALALYGREDQERLRGMAPDEVERLGRAGQLGLPLTSAATLGVAARRFRVTRIELGTLERTARVTAESQQSTDHRTIVFAMRLGVTGWLFDASPIEVR